MVQIHLCLYGTLTPEPKLGVLMRAVNCGDVDPIWLFKVFRFLIRLEIVNCEDGGDIVLPRFQRAIGFLPNGKPLLVKPSFDATLLSAHVAILVAHLPSDLTPPIRALNSDQLIV